MTQLQAKITTTKHTKRNNKQLIMTYQQLNKKYEETKSEVRRLRGLLGISYQNESYQNKQLHKKANLLLLEMFDVDICENTRRHIVVKGRQFFCRYFYDTGKGLVEIAKLMADSSDSIIGGTQDHSTIINSLKRFNDFYELEKSYKRDYDIFKEQMNKKEYFLEQLENAS